MDSNKLATLTFRTLLILMLSIGLSSEVLCQKIVVDANSSRKYLVRPPQRSKKEEPKKKEELSISDKAITFGAGILTKLKSSLNLDEATENLKETKNKISGKKEEDQEPQPEKKKEDPGN